MTDVLSGISIWRLQEATDQYLSKTKPVLYQRSFSQTTFLAENFSWNEYRNSKQTSPGLNGILSKVTLTINQKEKRRMLNDLPRSIIIAVKGKIAMGKIRGMTYVSYLFC